eukprot:scaffold442_cov397-Prasinococcus_capsulatus_cf.AAC.22
MTETPKKTGIFGRMFGSTGKQYKQAKLGGKNEAYYDEETKSWRFPSDPAGPQPAATNVPPPPPKPFHQGVLAASSPPPRTLGSNGTGDMAANSLPTIPIARSGCARMDKPSGGTTVPPHTNPLRLTKVGSSGRLRGRYVDTFNPNLTAEGKRPKACAHVSLAGCRGVTTVTFVSNLAHICLRSPRLRVDLSCGCLFALR